MIFTSYLCTQHCQQSLHLTSTSEALCVKYLPLVTLTYSLTSISLQDGTVEATFRFYMTILFIVIKGKLITVYLTDVWAQFSIKMLSCITFSCYQIKIKSTLKLNQSQKTLNTEMVQYLYLQALFLEVLCH